MGRQDSTFRRKVPFFNSLQPDNNEQANLLTLYKKVFSIENLLFIKDRTFLAIKAFSINAIVEKRMCYLSMVRPFLDGQQYLYFSNPIAF